MELQKNKLFKFVRVDILIKYEKLVNELLYIGNEPEEPNTVKLVTSIIFTIYVPEFV